MQPISVIIPTFNEAHNIRAVLESVCWADEILVVDSFSEDDTVAIAREFTDFILQRPYKHSADQKNWAIPQVTHDWVLLVDADERVTPELRQEIQQYLQQPSIPFDAFWIGRQNHFLGKRVRYSGWRGDSVIRFFRKSCRYEDKNVHAEVITDGLRVGSLKHDLLHFTFRDSTHFLEKMMRYGKWSAKDHAPRTPRVTLYHLWIKPAFRFFKHFVWQLGFLDGRTGFTVSYIMAWGVFLRYLYIMDERSKSAETGNSKT